MLLDRMNLSGRLSLLRSLDGWAAKACGCRGGGLGIEPWPWKTHKNPCRRKEPSDYAIFRRAVKRQRLHTLNTHDMKPRTTQQHFIQTPYTLELDFIPFPQDVDRSFPPEWPIVSSEKKVSSYKLHMTPSMTWYQGINHWVANVS